MLKKTEIPTRAQTRLRLHPKCLRRKNRQLCAPTPHFRGCPRSPRRTQGPAPEAPARSRGARPLAPRSPAARPGPDRGPAEQVAGAGAFPGAAAAQVCEAPAPQTLRARRPAAGRPRSGSPGPPCSPAGGGRGQQPPGPASPFQNKSWRTSRRPGDPGARVRSGPARPTAPRPAPPPRKPAGAELRHATPESQE